ncbi:hypothetical protein IPN41_03265 [Candidatus Falkowbacteria bacterium]|nr:MAG: hypothetical protein IPN41_03265 [Candidatus Falkowbacteria bacterium]
MEIKRIKIILGVCLFILLMLPGLTFALPDSDIPGGNPPGGNDPNSAKTVSLTNPIGSSDVPTLIGKIISAVLGVIGSLALLMVIYGGFTWMLAAGSSEKIKKGRDIIVWAILGLVVIFTSYALVRFVITSI